ncbi:MAG: hypothetical protein IKR41_07695 [Bacteroidales bacterium]|nr:hypothetical protein [Bacteroidales bacterium]
MKKVLLLILILTLSISVFSQNDGDVEIFYEDSGDSTQIKLSDEDYGEVHKFSETNPLKELFSPLLSKGWRAFGGFGFYSAQDRYNCDIFEVYMSLGWQFNPYLYLGLGFSEELYFDHWYYGQYASQSTAAIVLPLYSNFRYDVLNKKVTPFLDFGLGYAATDDRNNSYSGLYCAANLGLRIFRANVSFGYNAVKLDRPWHFLEFENGGYNYKEVKWQGAYSVRIAVDFGGTF